MAFWSDFSSHCRDTIRIVIDRGDHETRCETSITADQGTFRERKQCEREAPERQRRENTDVTSFDTMYASLIKPVRNSTSPREVDMVIVGYVANDDTNNINEMLPKVLPYKT